MVTDFHSHILPALDDGSRDLEMSLRMLDMASGQGIRRMAATPHFYPHRDDPEAFLAARKSSWEDLCRARKRPHPELLPGAEVYFFRGISGCDFLEALAIGDTGCVMVEMPPAPWPEEFYRELEELRRHRGLTPIIAHVDRYIRPLHTFSIPQRLAELPVLVQANAEFFTDRRTAGFAMKLLRRGQIQLLGSDCHDLSHRRPNLGEAVRRIEETLGPEILRQMEDLEESILG